MPERFWKTAIFIVGLAIIVALFVLGVNIAVVAGRAAVGFGFRELFPSPFP